jgi:hypothetical protein
MISGNRKKSDINNTKKISSNKYISHPFFKDLSKMYLMKF